MPCREQWGPWCWWDEAFHSRWWSLAKETGAVRLEGFSHWRRMTDWGSFTQSLAFSRLRLCLENQVVCPASSCWCCHTYVAWLLYHIPQWYVPEASIQLGPYFIVIAYFIETLLILANFPNRASSYLLIQKLSSDNRWLQDGPSSKPIHPRYPMSKIPQVNTFYLFIIIIFNEEVGGIQL